MRWANICFHLAQGVVALEGLDNKEEEPYLGGSEGKRHESIREKGFMSGARSKSTFLFF